MTVFDNVAFAMRVTGSKENKIQKRVPFVLDIVGLTDKMNCYPTELSGGEQQRVALARALANNADLIIADEPTGNVDPHMSLEIVDLLMRLNQEGTTVIMVTHEHNLVRMYDKRVILLENGTVAADGRMKIPLTASARLQIKQSQPTGGRLRNEVSRRRGRSSGGETCRKGTRKAPGKGGGDSKRDRRRRYLQAGSREHKKRTRKESTGYGSEYDTTYSSVLADYSIYLEDDGEGTRAMKITEASATSPARE